MMKTSTCLHIVAVYDNTMSGFISWRYTEGLLGIFDPTYNSRVACLCEVVLLSSCRNRYFYLYTSKDVSY